MGIGISSYYITVPGQIGDAVISLSKLDADVRFNSKLYSQLELGTECLSYGDIDDVINEAKTGPFFEMQHNTTTSTTKRRCFAAYLMLDETGTKIVTTLMKLNSLLFYGTKAAAMGDVVMYIDLIRWNGSAFSLSGYDVASLYNSVNNVGVFESADSGYIFDTDGPEVVMGMEQPVVASGIVIVFESAGDGTAAQQSSIFLEKLEIDRVSRMVVYETDVLPISTDWDYLWTIA
jgi:hypothetical protein